MTQSFTLPFPPADSNKVCYLILPQGVTHDLEEGLCALSKSHSMSMVLIDQVNWNDDLTPWPAPGVFKKAKPFGGKASQFLETLTRQIIPEAETSLRIQNAERTLLGVSLSGLFALWSGFNTDLFANIVSISGSLWYDGFTEWLADTHPSPQLKKTVLLLGDKEKNSKEKRMATVEDRTIEVVNILKKKGQGEVCFELVEGTHFSPIMPRLERAFSLMKP